MARNRRIVHWPKDGERMGDFVVDEKEAKVLARAIELMHLTKGNLNAVCDILSLETGSSTIVMIGYVKLAHAYYTDPDSVYIEEWQGSREFFPLA